MKLSDQVSQEVSALISGGHQPKKPVRVLGRKASETDEEYAARRVRWEHNAPINPFFAGAERPRLGEDY